MRPGICQVMSSMVVDSPIFDAADPPVFSEWNTEPISLVSQTCPEPCLGFPAFCDFSNLAEERLLLAHFDCVMYELLTPSPGDTNPFQELILPLFLENTALLNGVDALLGMSAPLWPALHRIAQLLDLKMEFQAAKERKENSKAAVLREELRISADAIQYSLENWDPHLGVDLVDASEVLGGQSAIHSALSYRHSSLVYLFRTIHKYPGSHIQVQSHVRASLKHCNDALSAADPPGTLLWPLFVAACEAISVGDRILADKAFLTLSKRQDMGNVNKAWYLTQQIWGCLDTSSGGMANSGMLPSYFWPEGDGQCIPEAAMATTDNSLGLIIG
ncbi:hypothetical protein CEP51_011577 [Fusarium floridanum]|uniref:Uncharacterized protein n=1 Tax=Fusarium floridanum TaxID=1325733 RepID=A0A428RA11_9HYPO|nr:hypothetical protein CEP51_011577 [Fusarium floridanum]